MYSSSTQKSHTRWTNFHPSSAPPPHIGVHSTCCGQSSVLEELKEGKKHQVVTEGYKSRHICVHVRQNAFWTLSLNVSNITKDTKSEHRNPWKSMTVIPLLLWRLKTFRKNSWLHFTILILHAKSKDLENEIPVSNGHQDTKGTPNPEAASIPT